MDNEELELRIDMCKSDWQQFNDSQIEIKTLGVHDDDGSNNEQEIFISLIFTLAIADKIKASFKNMRTNVTEGNCPMSN